MRMPVSWHLESVHDCDGYLKLKCKVHFSLNVVNKPEMSIIPMSN